MRETLYHDTQRATDVIDVDWRESTFDTQKATDVIDLDWRKSTWDYATLPRLCTRMQRRKDKLHALGPNKVWMRSVMSFP